MKNQFEIEQATANGFAYFLAFVLFLALMLGFALAGYTAGNMASPLEASETLELSRQ